MDLSFALQAKAVLHLLANHAELEKAVYTLPREVDEEIAHLKLLATGLSIDRLSPEQHRYLTESAE